MKRSGSGDQSARVKLPASRKTRENAGHWANSLPNRVETQTRGHEHGGCIRTRERNIPETASLTRTDRHFGPLTSRCVSNRCIARTHALTHNTRRNTTRLETTRLDAFKGQLLRRSACNLRDTDFSKWSAPLQKHGVFFPAQLRDFHSRRFLWISHRERSNNAFNGRRRFMRFFSTHGAFSSRTLRDVSLFMLQGDPFKRGDLKSRKDGILNIYCDLRKK